MIVNLTSDCLPQEGRYVLAHHTRGTWIDSTDQYGCEWVVVKMRRGISLEEREAMDDSDERKRIYCMEDEFGNNNVPYAWAQFGPDSFFGQNIDMWMEIPRNKQPATGHER
jgi:hypothetical protein